MIDDDRDLLRAAANNPNIDPVLSERLHSLADQLGMHFGVPAEPTVCPICGAVDLPGA